MDGSLPDGILQSAAIIQRTRQEVFDKSRRKVHAEESWILSANKGDQFNEALSQQGCGQGKADKADTQGGAGSGSRALGHIAQSGASTSREDSSSVTFLAKANSSSIHLRCCEFAIRKKMLVVLR